MNIAPHWSRARLDMRGQPDPDGVITAFGWSFDSPSAADAHATQRAHNLLERVRRLQAAPRGEPLRDDYYGSDRPVREPILEVLGDSSDPWGMVTRNRYGALVLNTSRAMFVDLDLPQQQPDRRTWWQRVVQKVPPPPAADPSMVLRRAADVVRQHGLGMRVYRTAAGFRGLVTTQAFDPVSDASHRLLQDLGSDPLYVKLCRTQRCFRARLTAKPWRVGLESPPWNWFPAQTDPERIHTFQAWLARYEQRVAGVPVCEVVDHLGADRVDAEVAPVLLLHDRHCLGTGELA